MKYPNINKWYSDGQKKGGFPKNYFKGFGEAIMRGEKMNKAAFHNEKVRASRGKIKFW